MAIDFDPRPVGVFDSGIGGLTVLKELAYQFPNESFIYLGDTARLPYGSKSPQTIRKYTEQNIDFLIRQNVKAIVIACNSASTQMREFEYKGIRIYNVIDPGAATALAKSESGRIGVLGTRATIQSESYALTIKQLNSQAQIFSIACPLFVPLAEENWDNDPITNLIAFRYLQPILQENIDVLILGCTHYPLLKNSIAKVTGSAIELVDSGMAVCDILRKDFEALKIIPGFTSDSQNSDTNSTHKREIHLLTTDSSAHFNQLAQKILLPTIANHFECVNV